jgi:hypothetical protein
MVQILVVHCLFFCWSIHDLIFGPAQKLVKKILTYSSWPFLLDLLMTYPSFIVLRAGLAPRLLPSLPNAQPVLESLQ